MAFGDWMSRAHEIIVAPATPRGTSALAVLRVSGPGAFELVACIAKPPPTSATWPHARATRVAIADGDQPVDDAVLVAWHGPRSYTGQDVVELSLHGNPLIVDQVTRLLCRHGARLAEPGEFTLRAVLAGKIDLVQAEAVEQVVSAMSQAGLRCAGGQLQGRLSERIRLLKDDALRLYAALEMAIDFPEEDDAPVPYDQLVRGAEALADACSALVHGAEQAHALFERQAIAIVGPPNAGKSTLFNALLESDRAIVSDTPGTTRDALYAQLAVAGQHLDLVDTAGIRDTADAIEREGVARAWETARQARLVIAVTDAQQAGGSRECAFLEAVRRRLPDVLHVRAKADLLGDVPDDGTLYVSARTGLGMDALRASIGVRLEDFAREAEAVDWMPTRRQLELCHRMVEHAARARDALQLRHPAEAVSIELRECLHVVQSMLGEEVEPDVLGEIFSRFCIGK